MIWPLYSTAFLLWLIMIWLVVIGIFRIAGAFALPKGDPSKWLLGFNGTLALIIGVLLLCLPLLEGLLLWPLAVIQNLIKEGVRNK